MPQLYRHSDAVVNKHSDESSWHASCTMENRFKALRKALGLTQQQLARKMGVSQATVSDLESGTTKNPRIRTAIRAARVLKAENMKAIVRGEDMPQAAAPDFDTETKVWDLLTQLSPTAVKMWLAAGEAMRDTEQKSSDSDEPTSTTKRH